MNHVHINGVSMVIGMLNHLPERQDRAIRAALVSCGKLAMREAKDNAPVSPKNSILSATLKRKKRTARKTFPGGLEKSIQYEVQGVGKNAECSVFVASNGHATTEKGYCYAPRIHDEKGKTWHKRGPGTIAKGQRADDKFIERAIRDNQKTFLKYFQHEIRKALP